MCLNHTYNVMAHCMQITDIGIQSIARNRGSSLLVMHWNTPIMLSYLVLCQTLNLGDLRQMSNISIQIIADHCVNLQSVSIAGSMQVPYVPFCDHIYEHAAF